MHLPIAHQILQVPQITLRPIPRHPTQHMDPSTQITQIKRPYLIQHPTPQYQMRLHPQHQAQAVDQLIRITKFPRLELLIKINGLEYYRAADALDSPEGVV